MGKDLTDNLHLFLHSEEVIQDGDNGEVDEDQEGMLEIERLRQSLLELKEQLRQKDEEVDRLQQIMDEKIQILAKEADESFYWFGKCVDLVLDEERARFVYQKAAESFQSDTMRPEESTLQFLKRLALEFHEQKLRDENETDSQVLLDADIVIERVRMFLTDQERIHLSIDKEAENN